MTRPTLWQNLRSFFLHANSTTWPGPRHSLAIRILVCSALCAATQLALCTTMLHMLLHRRRTEVECWDIDAAADLSRHTLLNKVFGTTMKQLPVTFVNLDALAAGKEDVLGPKYLSAGELGAQWAGNGTVIMSLLIIPLSLFLILVWIYCRHLWFTPVSNRTGMLLGASLWTYFVVNMVSLRLYDISPVNQGDVLYEKCWRSDGTMRALASWGRWVDGLKITGSVVGAVGCICMFWYFMTAFSAAMRNQYPRDQIPVRLADLSGLATSSQAGQSGNGNAAGPSGAATSANMSAQPTVNAAPRSAQDVIAPAQPVAKKQTQQKRQQERQETDLERLHEIRHENRTEGNVNPFTDPRNVVA